MDDLMHCCRRPKIKIITPMCCGQPNALLHEASCNRTSFQQHLWVTLLIILQCNSASDRNEYPRYARIQKVLSGGSNFDFFCYAPKGTLGGI